MVCVNVRIPLLHDDPDPEAPSPTKAIATLRCLPLLQMKSIRGQAAGARRREPATYVRREPATYARRGTSRRDRVRGQAAGVRDRVRGQAAGVRGQAAGTSKAPRLSTHNRRRHPRPHREARRTEGHVKLLKICDGGCLGRGTPDVPPEVPTSMSRATEADQTLNQIAPKEFPSQHHSLIN